jgi:hypothetical protein
MPRSIRESLESQLLSALVLAHIARRGLLDLERITAQVAAVQFDEVEGVEEHVPVVLAVADTLERCEPVVAHATASPSIMHERALRKELPGAGKFSMAGDGTPTRASSPFFRCFFKRTSK